MESLNVEKILLQIEEIDGKKQRYRFVRKDGHLQLIGQGAFSYVYQMYDAYIPGRYYAAKIVGLKGNTIQEELVLEAVQYQYDLSEQSEYIVRNICLKQRKIVIDEKGNLIQFFKPCDKQYDEIEGIKIQIIILEYLEKIIEKDKYGNVRLLRNALLDESEVLKFTENIGRALFVIHTNGFMHRDVKLENIFWDEKSQSYKLGDFGIIKYIGEGNAETVVLTDGYGAPEIRQRIAQSYNVTADIYSFGISLFLLLNDLKFPFSEGYYPSEVQYFKDSVIPAPVFASQKFSKIIRKMCNYQVKERYVSIEEVLMDIGRIDGMYTENGFLEYEEFLENTTVTYREESEELSKEKIRELESWEEDQKLDRIELKKLERRYHQQSIAISKWKVTVFSIIFLALFSLALPQNRNEIEGMIILFPIFILVYSFLQSIGEFQVLYGLFLIVLSGLQIYLKEYDIVYILGIFIVWLNSPVYTLSFGVGLLMCLFNVIL